MTSADARAANDARAAARSWMTRQPLFWALVGLDALAVGASVLGYLLTGNILAFAPIAVFAPVFAAGLILLTRRRARELAAASAPGVAVSTADPIVQ